MFPFVFSIVLSLARTYNISSVRLPYEQITFSSLLNPTQLYKVIVMALFAPYNLYLLRKSDVTSPDYFLGISLSKQFSLPQLQKTFESLRSGITEISCHPGYTATFQNYIDAHREDDMGNLGLVESDYEWVTKKIMEIADKHSNGRIISCLEGGYVLSPLARSVAAHIKVLIGAD